MLGTDMTSQKLFHSTDTNVCSCYWMHASPIEEVSWCLQIGNAMEEAEFTKRVVPCVAKLFASTDRSIRRSLLENIEVYGKHLTPVLLP